MGEINMKYKRAKVNKITRYYQIMNSMSMFIDRLNVKHNCTSIKSFVDVNNLLEGASYEDIYKP